MEDKIETTSLWSAIVIVESMALVCSLALGSDWGDGYELGLAAFVPGQLTPGAAVGMYLALFNIAGVGVAILVRSIRRRRHVRRRCPPQC